MAQMHQGGIELQQLLNLPSGPLLIFTLGAASAYTW